MDDLAIQRLVSFKLKVLTGMVTDWPGEKYHHITSMTCTFRTSIVSSTNIVPTWPAQLAQILQKFRIAPEEA